MSAIPLACDMTVFTPSQREQHVQATRELLSAVRGIHETDDGLEFKFINGTGSIAQVAEFIANERLCCPFLEFTLKIGPSEELISLALTGPEGTQEFCAREFNEAFA